MALVKCSECGKEISDKAKKCPHCGNKVKEDISYVKCNECEKKYDASLKCCPSCGMPNEKDNENNIVSNEDKKKKNIWPIILLSSLLLIIILFSLFTKKGSNNYNDNYEKPDNSYDDNNENNNNDNGVEDESNLPELTVTKDVPTVVEGTYGNDKIKAEITIKGVYWTSKILPPTPRQSYYTYYDENDEEIYQVVEMVVKNIGTESFSNYIFEGFLSDTCTPTFKFDGGYTYNGISLIEVERDGKGNYDLSNFYSINPLVTKTIYAVKTVPNATKDLSLSVNLCFGDNKLYINW